MRSKTHGYIFALLAITIFSIQDGISKHLAGLYPPIFVTMIRYWAFAAFATLFAARMRGGLAVSARTARPWLQVARGILLASQIVIAITSFAVVGLAQSQAIFAATPLLVALLSMPILGERVGWRRWTAISIGLLGVLLILKPEGGMMDIKLALPLSASVLFALYVIATRLVSRDDAAVTSFFYTGAVGAAAISLVGPLYWTALPAGDWGWMILICITGISSHYLLIRAYEYLDAVVVQPLTYLQLVYAAIIGVAIFGETLRLNVVIGSVIVAGAGIFTVWREHAVARRQAAKTS